jgi:hypothetical protein
VVQYPRYLEFTVTAWAGAAAALRLVVLAGIEGAATNKPTAAPM